MHDCIHLGVAWGALPPCALWIKFSSAYGGLHARRRGESPVPSARGPSGEVAGGSRRPQIPTPRRKKPSAPVPVSGVPRLQLMSPGEGWVVHCMPTIVTVPAWLLYEYQDEPLRLCKFAF